MSGVNRILQPGWNMVGGTYSTVAAADVFEAFFHLVTWSGTGYVEASEFKPGIGHWALVLVETEVSIG